MRSVWLLLAALLFVSNAMIIPHLGKLKGHTPRVYAVQVDDPAEVRWAPMIRDYKHALDLFMAEFELIPIPKKFYQLLDWWAHNMFVHQDFVKEIDALAKVSGYPFGEIFFLNFMYEYSTIKACSTILVKSAGKVLHGRNLDFPMMRLLSNLVVTIDYYQGHKKVFTIDHVLGSVFALTGIRYGAFAVNVDTRYATSNIAEVFNILVEDAMPDVWLLRRVLAEETNYADALQRLKTTRIGAPVYFMISGVKDNEGCVIERDCNSVHASYELNDATWFLVQTNYDRDVPDPVIDPRRGAVENRLREQGNVGFTEKMLFEDFMTEWPTMNIGTIMTAIMVPGNDHHNSTVWYKSNPSASEIV